MMRLVYLLLPFALFTGCATISEFRYGPYEQDLDKGHELVISTYPAGFGTETDHTPYVSSKMETHDEVYLQVLVRAKKPLVGARPDPDDVTMHSFTYQFNGGEWVTLFKDLPNNFWMQNNVRYRKYTIDFGRDPLPYRKDAKVNFRLDLTLGDTRQMIEGTLEANKKKTTLPLFIRSFGP